MAAACTASALLLAGAGGCSSTPALCTTAGCDSGVRAEIFRLPPGSDAVILCVDDRCAREVKVRSRGPYLATLPYEPSETEVRASIRIRNAARQTLAQMGRELELVDFRPNGPDCEPVCVLAGLRWNVATGRVSMIVGKDRGEAPIAD